MVQAQSLILKAVEALRALDRDHAVTLLQAELRQGPASGERWRSVARLAAQIGETDIAIEAARRYARTPPVTLERLLTYWGELAQYGRTESVHAEINSLPEQARDHPALLHLQGTIEGQEGDFESAELSFRKALSRDPHLLQTWFALAMIKTFRPGDPDLTAMERMLPDLDRADPELRARFLFGLGKAWHDCREYDRAFALYSEGAALRRQIDRWDAPAAERFNEQLISDFTPETLSRLAPSSENRPAIFVNGLPRSGTTLTEQILVSHSRVADGGEVNLLRAALIPTGDNSLAGALRFQDRVGAGGDPWGSLARTYFRLLEMRFGTRALVVDKTLGHSRLMGLLLHALPAARVVWMRRNPEDTALSCFRTYFTTGVPWSWSLEDIGRFFRLEDRLYAHWTELFGDRILTVDYEAIAREPEEWVPRIAAHCGLELEPQMSEPHRTARTVLTASVQQVRSPITSDRIGQSAGYSAHLKPFREAYFR